MQFGELSDDSYRNKEISLGKKIFKKYFYYGDFFIIINIKINR